MRGPPYGGLVWFVLALCTGLTAVVLAGQLRALRYKSDWPCGVVHGHAFSILCHHAGRTRTLQATIPRDDVPAGGISM